MTASKEYEQQPRTVGRNVGSDKPRKLLSMRRHDTGFADGVRHMHTHTQSCVRSVKAFFSHCAVGVCVGRRLRVKVVDGIVAGFRRLSCVLRLCCVSRVLVPLVNLQCVRCDVLVVFCHVCCLIDILFPPL